MNRRLFLTAYFENIYANMKAKITIKVSWKIHQSSASRGRIHIRLHVAPQYISIFSRIRETTTTSAVKTTMPIPYYHAYWLFNWTRRHFTIQFIRQSFINTVLWYSCLFKFCCVSCKIELSMNNIFLNSLFISFEYHGPRYHDFLYKKVVCKKVVPEWS